MLPALRQSFVTFVVQLELIRAKNYDHACILPRRSLHWSLVPLLLRTCSEVTSRWQAMADELQCCARLSGPTSSAGADEFLTWRRGDSVKSKWKLIDDLESSAWEELVVLSEAHPLQTALWGEARAKADGTQSGRLLFQCDGAPALLARVEVRRHPFAGKVAWIPQGPVYVDAELGYEASVVLKTELKARGYQICFENPYPHAPPRYSEHGISIGAPAQTGVVDVSVGEEVLWIE